MKQEDTVAAVLAAVMIRDELRDDYVGLWKIPRHLRRLLPGSPDSQILDLSIAILVALITLDVQLGDIDGETGVFVPWNQLAGVDRVEAEWEALGRDPNIGDIAWLAHVL